MQHAGVDADLIVAVVLPGVVLDHVEKLSNKKQDPMFRMILMETQKRQIISDTKQEGKKKKTETQVPTRKSFGEIKVPATINSTGK